MRRSLLLPTAALASTLTLGCADQQSPTAPADPPTPSLRAERAPVLQPQFLGGDPSNPLAVQAGYEAGLIADDICPDNGEHVDPAAPTFACEVETAAPLAPALAAGAPTAIDYRPSFVDGIGGRSILVEMWPLASTLLAGSFVVGLEEIAAAIRILVTRARVVAEGAGAASLAAAFAGRPATGTGGAAVPRPEGPVVCVVSGGNLDPARLATILEGRLP